MPIHRIYAHLSCRSLDASLDWFARLFDRAPDARPMTGLAEWHHEGRAGLQLFENPDDAGRGTLTLIVRDLATEHARLDAANLAPGPLERGDSVSLVRLRDPDGNLVVLAE
ncbi:VOC family protein [Roseobacter sp. HKCCA0434]|uniref:VOC family protein n=1 Tax=Roseobacter sp. HKCCA0434 TaxID=3079297 RepID=UPI002905A09E|nr:VOC family protein [Roseobacter sp. HKCCA0434]